MRKKHVAIIHLDIGPLIIKLSMKMGVRKIASHLEKKGYLYKGKPISKDAVHRYLIDYKKGAITPTPSTVIHPSVVTSGHEGLLLTTHKSPALDVTTELVESFRSCKKLYEAQLKAIEEATENGSHVDRQDIRTVLSTSRTLLDHLSLYMQRLEGFTSGASLQQKVNEYNTLMQNIILIVTDEVLTNDKLKERFYTRLKEICTQPPESVFPEGSKPS